MQSLPQDLTEKIFLLAGGDPKDIVRCAQVCRSFREAAAPARLWRELAYLFYGEEIAEKSGPLYCDDWKVLVLDDNELGAVPTRATAIPCMWRYNTTTRFYCCIVHCVKWNRLFGDIRVYIDVRGEFDLRHPMESSLAMYTLYDTVERDASTPVVHVRPTRFFAEEGNTPKHFKGCLTFPGDLFQMAGTYKFCYANSQDQGWGVDYEVVNLLEIPEGGLEKAFAVGRHANAATNSRVSYTAANVSPFVDDTPDVERKRWEATVPKAVMDRTPDEDNHFGAWYA